MKTNHLKAYETDEESSLMNKTQSQLNKLIDHCFILQKQTIKNQNKLEIERENQENMNQRIDSCLEMLKENEHVESNMIQPIFVYYKQNLIDQK